MGQYFALISTGVPRLGLDQGPDHASEGVGPVKDPQVPPAGDPRLLPDQFHHQLTFGPENYGVIGVLGLKRQLGFPEVEPSRQGQAPGGLTGVVEQGPEHHPVVGPHGGSSIGTAGGIFVEGAGSPDVRAIAMDLGVIDGRDMIAVPEPPGGGLDQPGQAGGDVVGVPGAVLGEGFQRLPVSGPLQGQDRLGDGVLLAVDGHGGDPFGEPAKAGAGEGPGEGRQQGLPDRPKPLSVSHGTSPVAVPKGFYPPL